MGVFEAEIISTKRLDLLPLRADHADERVIDPATSPGSR
jgi:hypothetical protein